MGSEVDQKNFPGTPTKRLFVAMPYDVREAPLDYDQPETSVKIDFDAVWEGILKPAIPAGFESKRADELRQPGLIDRLYIEWLYDADIVLADLTFGNPNVYYELGIRQALSKKGTVLVACRGTKLPFDVRNQLVIHYDYFAAPALWKFHGELRGAIENAAIQEVDSPVHVFLPGLVVTKVPDGQSAGRRVEELAARIKELEFDLSRRQVMEDEARFLRQLQEASVRSQVLGIYKRMPEWVRSSVDLLERMAVKLRKFGYFDEALACLELALELRPGDPELLREAGFVFRKKGPNFYLKAEEYMVRSLKLNDFDAELHGILGGLLKRREQYQEALSQYERAHELEPENLYALVNLGGVSAALGNIEAAHKWYQELRVRCEDLIANEMADYWTFLCLGEAAVALEDREVAISAYQRAIALRLPLEDLRSASEQLEFLLKINFAVETAREVLPVLNKRLSSLGKT